MAWEGPVLGDDRIISSDEREEDPTGLGTNGMTSNGWRAFSNCSGHCCIGGVLHDAGMDVYDSDDVHALYLNGRTAY